MTSSQAPTGASHGQVGDTHTQPTPNGVDENQEPSTKRRKIVETKQKGDDFVRYKYVQNKGTDDSKVVIKVVLQRVLGHLSSI